VYTKQMHIRSMVPLIGLAVVMAFAGCQAVKVAMPEPVAAPEVVSAPQEPVAEPKAAQPAVAEPAAPPTPEGPPPAPKPKTKAAEGPYFLHTVKWQGESLESVAAWYTGTTRNWRILGDANPQLASANRIALGTKIRIPEKMLRTRETMPQGFAESYAKPPKQSGTGTAGKTGEPLR
jgi:hypothetical protein